MLNLDMYTNEIKNVGLTKLQDYCKLRFVCMCEGMNPAESEFY